MWVWFQVRRFTCMVGKVSRGHLSSPRVGATAAFSEALQPHESRRALTHIATVAPTLHLQLSTPLPPPPPPPFCVLHLQTVLLAVNKCENVAKADTMAADFWELGLQPMTVR